MEFVFRSPAAARAAAAVLKNQLEQLMDKKTKITARADGSRVTIIFSSLSKQKKKAAGDTAKRLAELLRCLEQVDGL